MITPTEINKLNKHTIHDKLTELGLESFTKDVAWIKQQLRIWMQNKCAHEDSQPEYDLSALLCATCESLLEYDFDTDMNTCLNCGWTGSIDETGSMTNWNEFEWLESCITCFECDYRGHPGEMGESLLDEVEELVSY